MMGNPRFFWTYGDEDLVKWMIQIAEGVHPATLKASVLGKWLWCIFDQLLVNFDERAVCARHGYLNCAVKVNRYRTDTSNGPMG